jgi:predicted outer membrane repeat protein
VNIISNTASSDGGGIRCLLYSNPVLQNVTITDNTSSEEGGGIHCKYYSVPIFSSTDRCNIYLNYAGTDGNDLFSTEPLFVFADTFTVAQPDDYHASPIENFTFDILNSVIEQAYQDLYISPFGSDENGGLTADDPLQTISFALLKIYGDSLNTYTIHLSEGTFSPTQTGENFPLNCKDYISISGVEQNLTILDGEDLSTVISCSGDNNFSIENLTVMNGNGYNGGGICFMSNSAPHLENLLIINNHGYDGGGIHCYSYSSPSIENVEIINNQADYRGGGILCKFSSSPHILNSEINNNTAPWGGGIRLYYNCNAIIENVSISNNTASGGAGIYCNSSDPTLQNVIISNNIASATTGGNGGGIVCIRSEMTLLNTIIENNSSTRNGGGIYCILYSDLIMKNVIIANNNCDEKGGGIYCEDEYYAYAENLTVTGNSANISGGGIYAHYGYENDFAIRNSVLWNNSPQEISGSASVMIVSYSDIQGGWNGTGNINEDPLFIGSGEFPLALSEDSPCIDAGNPNSMFYDPEDPSDPGFALYPAMGTVHNDMGAYGGPNAIGWITVPVNDDVIIQPTLCKLYQNYPNPFNPSTTISFSLTTEITSLRKASAWQAQNTEIIIYNIKGQKVKQLISNSANQLSVGQHSVIWDGKDESEKPVGSGIYFYRLKVDDKTIDTKKCLLLK